MSDESEVPLPEVADLVFVGLNGWAVALHRDTGEIVWTNDQMQDGYVTLLLDGDRLIVSTNGYLYCLDPRTGQMRWSNAMEGFGMGTPTALCSARGSANPTTEMAHQRDVKIETWQK